jgi:ERCC4-type nuclease
MIIKVDNREHELLKQINQLVLFVPSFKHLIIKTENLPLGDIIISDEKEDKLIIERKSISDLLSSIKDGRYEEQSYRLNGLNYPNHNIYYLIEGDVNKPNRFKDNNVDKLTLYSSIFSLNYFKGFSVMRTFNMEETAIFICNTANKLGKSEGKNKKPYYQLTNLKSSNLIETVNVETENVETANVETENVETENVQNVESGIKEPILQHEVSIIEQSEKDYINVVKKVKKENITTENIGEIMLCQIPGISSVTAIAIMQKFGSISNLIKEVETNESCLQNISYESAKGQTRKIAKTSVASIIKFLIKK